jgi:hypothetical protein
MRLSHETMSVTGVLFAGKELPHEEEDIRHQSEVPSTQWRQQVALLASQGIHLREGNGRPARRLFPFVEPMFSTTRDRFSEAPTGGQARGSLHDQEFDAKTHAATPR